MGTKTPHSEGSLYSPYGAVVAVVAAYGPVALAVTLARIKGLYASQKRCEHSLQGAVEEYCIVCGCSPVDFIVQLLHYHSHVVGALGGACLGM